MRQLNHDADAQNVDDDMEPKDKPDRGDLIIHSVEEFPVSFHLSEPTTPLRREL